jgi:hypothetical protein
VRICCGRRFEVVTSIEVAASIEVTASGIKHRGERIPLSEKETMSRRAPTDTKRFDWRKSMMWNTSDHIIELSADRRIEN